MRRVIRDALIAVPALTAVVPAERWYAPGAVIDNPTSQPFVILRWIAPVPSGALGRWLWQLRVDVHDRRGSYARIESLLGDPSAGGGIYDVLAGIANLTGADGRVTQCDFVGGSGDQEDETYSTNYMFSSWQVIGVRA